MPYVLLLRLPVELFHIGFMKLEEKTNKKTFQIISIKLILQICKNKLYT